MPFAAVFLLSSCMGDIDTMKADIGGLGQASYETQRKQAETEKAISSLREDVGQLKESMAAMRDGQASLYTQTSDMLLELQAVRGRLDEQKHLVEKDFEKANAEVEVLKSRVDELAAPERAEEMDQRLSAIEASIALINGQVASLEEAAKAPSAPAEPSAWPKPATPDSAYDEAYALFKAKRYAEAREKMKDFLAMNPGHNLAGNAAFWIGETYYNEKAYEDAILAYEDVIQKYKGSPKAPSAMLKQAYSFIELGDKKAARAILNDLINQFPKDEAARAAKSKLKALD